jgi:hypothetical protein
MTIKNRTDLKSYFVKNAIPTEGNFADLIDSQLNQAQDGVFKPDGEALSLVAAPGDQKRVLRLYGAYPAANPDWVVALSPSPTGAGAGRAGMGVADGTGALRLFVDSATGRIGIGTNAPAATLDVNGVARANGFQGKYDAVLADYRTVNPGTNVVLQSPQNDRDAWIYRDAADPGSNWGIYHRQIDSAIAGLPANSLGFVGGGSSKLQAYIGLADGTLMTQGMISASTATQAWAGWYETIRFTRAEHAAITHPAGQLLFGMHSDRHFYFADTQAGKYVMTIDAPSGNVAVTGQSTLNGQVNAPAGVQVEGTVAHIERDGAFYRNTDGQVYITVDDNLYIRDASSGASWAAHFDTNGGGLEIKGGITTHGFGMLTDPTTSYNCHFPHSDKCSYVTGDHVYLRSGAPNGFATILNASNDGTVTVTGNFASHGYAPTSGLPTGWGGGVNTWDVVAHGTMWSVNPYRNGNFDYAETFAHHDAGVEAGDVVQPDPGAPERLVRSTGAYSDTVLGVISTKPGALIGCDWEDPDGGVPLALSGRVPVKVNLEGGAIRIGDYLASSSQPGVAMRTIRPGRVIGIALSAFDGTGGDDATHGRVVVFVNLHWFGGR